MRCLWVDCNCRCLLTTRRQRGTHRKARRGFTLIEMLVVLALLTILTGILVLLLKETLQIERSQARGFDKVLQNNALADQFRADVAQAENTSKEWQTFKADRRTLILQMPDGNHVVYVQQGDTLLRRAFENGKESVRTLPLGSDVDVEFAGDGDNLNLIRMRMHVLREGSPLPGQALEIAAALGGDWR
jgi:prepilin-type N-terminal cleavage/methylation domain-containing protein